MRCEIASISQALTSENDGLWQNNDSNVIVAAARFIVWMQMGHVRLEELQMVIFPAAKSNVPRNEASDSFAGRDNV